MGEPVSLQRLKRGGGTSPLTGNEQKWKTAVRFDSRLKTLLKNIFGSAASRVINLLITLAIVPLTINSLDANEYAFLSIAVSLSILSSYADFGMGLAIVNILAAESQTSTKHRSQRAVSVVWFTLLGVSTLALLASALAALWIFNLPNEATKSQYHAVLIGVTCIFAGLPTGLIQRILFATHRNIEANAWNTFGRLTSLALTWLAVEAEFSSLPLLIFFVIGMPVIVGWISVAVVFSRKSMQKLKPTLKLFDMRLTKPYTIIGLSFLLLQLVPYSETAIDPLLAGTFIGIHVIPSLDVHIKLFTYIPALVSIAAFPLWPAIASAHASGDLHWTRKIKKISYAVVFGISSILAVLLVTFGTKIIKYWTNQDLSIPDSALIGMAVFSVMTCIGTVQSMILSGLGVIKKQAAYFIPYIVTLISSKVIFAYLFGVPGLILSLVACYSCRLIISEIALERLLRKH